MGATAGLETHAGDCIATITTSTALLFRVEPLPRQIINLLGRNGVRKAAGDQGHRI